MDALEFHWQVVHSLRKFKEYSEHIVQPFCQTHGITPMQLRILTSLQQKGGQSVSELARNTCMAGANTSALCKRLDKESLVSRSRGPDDERLVLITLTPAGEEIMQAFMAEYAREVNTLLAQAPEKDKELILQGMQCLADLLDKNYEETPLWTTT